MEKIYGIDQQILDERGIGLTVSQVVNLSSAEYSDRLRRLCLPPRDETFVKRLRRRIKNRMASQNSRRRTAEHIKTLKAELRVMRASKQHALEERRKLLKQREALVERYRSLGKYLREKLSERQDMTPLPAELELRGMENLTCRMTEPARAFKTRLDNLVVRRIDEMYRYDIDKSSTNDSILDFTTFKLKNVNKNVKDADLKPNIKMEMSESHDISIKDNIHNEKEEVAKIISNLKLKTEYNKIMDQDINPEELPKIIRAKCVPVESANDNIDMNMKDILLKKLLFVDKSIDHLNDDKPKKVVKKKSCIVHTSDLAYDNYYDNFFSKNSYFSYGGHPKSEMEVLNLSLKPGLAEARRRHHGRKQAAPRRITHSCQDDDDILDLKLPNGD